MKKLLLAGVVAFSLAGCGKTGDGVISILPQNLQTLVANSCSVVISLEAASQLLSLFVPQVETVQQLVAGFCSAVLPPTGRARLAGSTVKGNFRGVTFYGKIQPQ